MCLKYILMFPGQGSQRKRMFDDFRVFPDFERIAALCVINVKI